MIICISAYHNEQFDTHFYLNGSQNWTKFDASTLFFDKELNPMLKFNRLRTYYKKRQFSAVFV